MGDAEREDTAGTPFARTTYVRAMNQELDERFTAAALEAIPERTLDALGRDYFRAAIARHLATAWTRTWDRAVAEGFQQWCPIEGTTVDDYLYRLVVADDVAMLTSPRYKGGDRAKPFVNIEASTRSGPPDEQMLDALGSAYRVHSPQRARWFDPTPLDALTPESRVDFRVVAGRLSTIRAHRPAAAGEMQLVRATALDWYDRYVDGYRRHFEAHPELVGRFTLETRETLQSIIDRRTLFEAWSDGAWVGVIGVWPEQEHYIDGYVVVERMLMPEACGRGLGAALLWHLAGALELPEETVLHGSIADVNVRSYSSALRVGRIDAGGYLWAALQPR
jgi:hypothetical protein